MTSIRKIKRRADAMHIKDVGPRCRSYGLGCITCTSWHWYDLRGGFPTFEQVVPANDYAAKLDDEFHKEHGRWPDGEHLERLKAMVGEFIKEAA